MTTIRDVARAAGVSIATVSRVFNGNPRVGEDTALRVWDAAGELDYWPNGAARSLTTSRTQTLGVLLPDLYGDFFSEVIRGIDQAARRAHFQILLSSSHADPIEIVAAARAMRGRVDGLIIMASDRGTAEAVLGFLGRQPLVFLNPYLDPDGCSAVSIDNRAGGRSAVEHLIALGHRVIATVRGPEGNIDAEERLGGYRDALAGAGLSASPQLELPGDFTETAGFRAVSGLLAAVPRPTAVFAANDAMAAGLLGGLRDAGVAVPGEMAVVGFDDIGVARCLTPPLTSVRVDVCELGRRAVQLLLETVGPDGPAPCRREVLPARLVLRESCGCRSRTELPVLARGAGDSGERDRI